jgi:glycine/D-amino acid oxidase-like deaminating enzyme
MGPPIDDFDADQSQPAKTGVVVVGGGIIGVSTALSLAQAGIAVTLCEKGQIAGEQSSRNWGWVRKTGRDEREIPLIVESLRMWQGMNRKVEGETGFRECGILYTSQNDDMLANHEAWLERARPYQLGSRLVRGEELHALLPGSTLTYKAGLYTPTDGRAEPQKATTAIAKAAQRAGAVILTNCAVRGLDVTGGKVSGVVTERGRIASDGVVLAGGAWSRLFCGNHGLRLPQLKVHSSVLRTAPLEGGPEVTAWHSDFAYRKRMDGGYTIGSGRGNVVPLVPDTAIFFRDFLPALRSTWDRLHLRIDDRFLTEARTPRRWSLDVKSPFEDERMLDPKPVRKMNDDAMRAIAAAYPVFRNARIVQEWAGLIDVTPDAVPVISPVDALPGLVIATGFSGHGFGIGPAAGQLAAELIMGARPLVDPTPFRFSRFSDGSPIYVEAPA